jgi:alpha-galactosidase
MGWNSYDSYGGGVNEQEVKTNAKYMAEHLASYGWNYVVIDYYWYFPHPIRRGDQGGLEVAMDDYGRLLPALNRFPSAAGGQGFKPIADYVHSLGLKFGIHIMRGIPRAAVQKNLAIFGTHARARDIADLHNICTWSKAMYGVDASKPAGQAYYNSIAKLYTEWGVDYIKADDMSWSETKTGETYHAQEIEALRRALNNCGRRMVLSLSPGPTEVDHAAHVVRWSQLWRISSDIWDDWDQVKQQFDYCRIWAPYIGPNHWPDADMLPLGRLRIRYFGDGPRFSRLSRDEQTTLLTLWSIFRSPLMMGGDLPSSDPTTLSLLMNKEVIAVDQASSRNRELFRRDNEVAWTADVPGTRAKYVALFNLADAPREVGVSWKELGLSGKCRIRDLWQKKELGTFEVRFATIIPPHLSQLCKVEPLAQ